MPHSKGAGGGRVEGERRRGMKVEHR